MRSSTQRRELTQVARQLFTDQVHQTLVQFMQERAQFLPLEYEGEHFSRFMAQNVGIFQHIHNQLVDFASEQFGEEVKPSYSFLSMYDDNGICPLHIDRDQCLYTIDYLIRQDSPEPWPIYIGQPISDEERNEVALAGMAHPEDEHTIFRIKERQNFTKVELQPNDAVLYSGTHQWHYRDHIPSGTADLAFFHFVPEAFDGSLI
jgi:hypothetical protein